MAVSALATLSAADGAWAASSDAAAGAASGASDTATVEQIVVTARRSSERLSDVPVAVSAIGAEAMKERHIVTEQDLQTATPGLTVYGTGSSNGLNYSLRGQSVDAFSFAAPAVLTYVNEFSVQNDSASSFYDLDSVQVLKGPQGTLFGRNATGGAVLFQTQKPRDDFDAYAKVGFGNYAHYTGEAAINFPLEGIGAVRVAGHFEKRDGYQHNLLLNVYDGSVDDAGGRVSVLIKPAGGKFDSLTVAQYEYTGGYSVGLKAQNVVLPGETNNGYRVVAAIPSSSIYVPGVVVQNPMVAQLGFNGIVDFLNKQRGYGFYDIFDSHSDAHHGEDWLITNNSTYEISDALKIKNVIGFHSSRSHDLTDVNGGPYQPLTIGFVDSAAAEGYHYTDRQFSEEIQASGNLLDRKLKYIGGFYYFHGFEEQRLPLDIVGDLVNPTTGAPIPPSADFLRDYSFTTNSEAVYAQATYSFTDRLHLTAGGRYTHESTYYTPVGADLEGLLGVKPSTLVAAKPSWTVSLDYKPTSGLMIYAANRGSWRSGGFNGTSQNFLPNGAAVAQSFLPETTYDFEIGAKFNGEVASMPASLNIALYDQFINNVIRAIYFNDSANSGNVKAANVRGVEADGSIRPSRWFQLGFSTAYTDARYTQPQASINGTFVVFGPYGDTPAWTGSVYGRVSTDLADGSELAARVDYYGQTHFFYSNAAASILPNTEIPGYSLLNLRLEWNKIRGGNISVAAWMKNATDTHYFTGGFALGAVTGINSTLEGEPRMFGLDLTAKF